MIVTCPVCSTRYLVDPRNLGAAGRVVRCAGCAHTWHQTPPEDAPLRVDAPLELADPPKANAAPGTSGRVQLPAVPTPRRSYALLGWSAYAVLLIGLIAGGAWFTRDRLIALVPELARYYAMLGVSTTMALSDGFEVLPPTRTRDTVDGQPTLIIEGEVVNISKVVRQVPKLKVILLDSDHRELQSWVFTVSDDRLLPGASAAYRTSIAQNNENPAATMIEVSVVDGN